MSILYTDKLKKIMILIKFFCTLLFPVLCFISDIPGAGKKCVLMVLTECIFFFLLTTLISKRFRIVAYIFNVIFCLIVNVQFMVLFFSNSYISMNMITNLRSILALKGHWLKYSVFTLFVIIVSFLPVFYVEVKGNLTRIIWVVLVFMFIVVFYSKSYLYSSLISFCKLETDYCNYVIKVNRLKKRKIEKNIFYKKGIDDYYINSFVEKPNIVLIFTEGLSENIINDSREIMPNVKKFSENSMRFKNYYNHTFATYMGLCGQLYSGYHQSNLDKNNLISIQKILKDNGYETVFINTEPNNKDFSQYLNNFEFDKVVTEYGVNDGMSNSISDKSAYDFLHQIIQKQYKKTKPFFVCIYTFGTHASFDSTDLKFGDKSDSLLNRFYNCDYWFGEWFQKFYSSEISDNTIVVFTSDHATYNDYDFASSFPQYERKKNNLDTIPLYIYYSGIDNIEINTFGRTSIDLAPTILDLIDLNGENFFLGSSLFGEKSYFSNKFQSVAEYYTIENSEICSLNKSDLKLFESSLENYFSINNQKSATAYYDFKERKIILQIENIDSNITYLNLAIWNCEESDKCKWFDVPYVYNENVSIDLEDFLQNGIFEIHVYGTNTLGEQKFITWSKCVIEEE